MLERVAEQGHEQQWFCNVCARSWRLAVEPARFRSLDHFVSASGARRDELATLAEIGALNAFGYDRRAALWQIERVVRPAGELYEEEQDQPAAYGLQPSGSSVSAAGWRLAAGGLESHVASGDPRMLAARDLGAGPREDAGASAGDE